jgi:hypothetical protein
MRGVQIDKGVMNLFNFIAILIAMAIVVFLTVYPLDTITSSPNCVGYIFAYMVCP